MVLKGHHYFHILQIIAIYSGTSGFRKTKMAPAQLQTWPQVINKHKKIFIYKIIFYNNRWTLDRGGWNICITFFKVCPLIIFNISNLNVTSTLQILESVYWLGIHYLCSFTPERFRWDDSVKEPVDTTVPRDTIFIVHQQVYLLGIHHLSEMHHHILSTDIKTHLEHVYLCACIYVCM